MIHVEQSQIGELTTRGTPRLIKPFVQYSDELATEICGQLALGRSIKSICTDEGMPTEQSIYKWLLDYPQFVEIYTKAKQDSADSFVDEIIDIADAPVPNDHHGRMDAGVVQKQRLRVDARKWIASKLKPKVYGERLDVAHSGNISVTRTCFTLDATQQLPAIEGNATQIID